MPSMRYLSVGGLPVLSVDDTLGLPWKVLADGILFRSGTGDDSFRIDSLSVGSHTLTLDVVSFPLSRLEVVISPLLPPPPDLPPPPPPPPPPFTGGGYVERGKVGPRCTVLQKGFGPQEFMFLRNDVTGAISPGYTTMTKLYDGPYRKAFQCDEPMPPTPQEWSEQVIDLVKKGFSEFSASIDTALKQTWDEIAGIKKFIDGLEGWLVERLVGLMLRALDREAEAKK